MSCQEIEISKSAHILGVRFKECELIYLQLQNVDNGFFFSYVTIYNFEIFRTKYPWTSPFSVRLKSAIVENFLKNLFDF